jgi:23S rRNA pseudouridine1911/1915/1917 synthase
VESYSILYEDEDVVVANKLTPMPVQPEKSGDPSLQDFLREELGKRGERGAPALEAAHRIDRRASGAVLFAKTRKALVTLEAAFRDRRIEKEYLACVEREPGLSTGRLEHQLAWDKRNNVVRALPAGSDRGKKALLEYRLAGRSDRYFFLSVDLITGRHHQVRAQLAAIGCPIRGDLKYGAKRGTPSGLLMLHARRLAFLQPRTGERVELLAPFPAAEPLWAAIDSSGAVDDAD